MTSSSKVFSRSPTRQMPSCNRCLSWMKILMPLVPREIVTSPRAIFAAGSEVSGDGHRGERSTRLVRVRLRRRQHSHHRRVGRQQFRWGRVGLDEERRSHHFLALTSERRPMELSVARRGWNPGQRDQQQPDHHKRAGRRQLLRGGEQFLRLCHQSKRAVENPGGLQHRHPDSDFADTTTAAAEATEPA